jgi:hypothetical protein
VIEKIYIITEVMGNGNMHGSSCMHAACFPPAAGSAGAGTYRES